MGLDELSALVGLLDGDCTTSELALRIGTSLAATERSVSRLKKQSYATTIDLNLLHLTDEGIQRAQRMHPVALSDQWSLSHLTGGQLTTGLLTAR